MTRRGLVARIRSSDFRLTPASPNARPPSRPVRRTSRRPLVDSDSGAVPGMPGQFNSSLPAHTAGKAAWATRSSFNTVTVIGCHVADIRTAPRPAAFSRACVAGSGFIAAGSVPDGNHRGRRAAFVADATHQRRPRQLAPRPPQADRAVDAASLPARLAENLKRCPLIDCDELGAASIAFRAGGLGHTHRSRGYFRRASTWPVPSRARSQSSRIAPISPRAPERRPFLGDWREVLRSPRDQGQSSCRCRRQRGSARWLRVPRNILT